VVHFLRFFSIRYFVLYNLFQFFWFGRNRKRRKSNLPNKDHFRRLYFEIIDTIIVQLNARFEDMDALKILALVNSSKFPDYNNKFPEDSFNLLKTSYGDHFNFPRLRSELCVVYSKEEFRGQTISQLYSTLYSSEMQDILPEMFKLCGLILCIPATSASAERSFSALKRIKNYLRTTTSQDRLSYLSLISIEKQFINILSSRPSFYDDVIDRYAAKPRRIELKFK
jgi:hypothetical protein